MRGVVLEFAGVSPPSLPKTRRCGNGWRSANPTLRVPEAGSATVELSVSPLCPAAPGCSSTRSHREQSRIALTLQVAQPGGRNRPASRWTSCTARMLRNRTVCSSVLACNSRAMKSTCTIGAPRRQPLACPLAKSSHLSTPQRWGLQLWLPQRCLHNLVGIGHSCSRSASSQHAMRSLPVSTIGVPTRDAMSSKTAIRHYEGCDSGSCAVFTEQGSSALQMTAAKVMDIISRLPGCAGHAADAVSA